MEVKKEAKIFVLGLVVGILLLFCFDLASSFFAQAAVKQKIKNFYELLLPGTRAEVVALEEQKQSFPKSFTINKFTI